MGNGDVDFVSSHLLAIRGTVAVLIVLLQSANFMAAVNCSTQGESADRHHRASDLHRSHVDLTELGRNIIKGLKLEKLPDMVKTDISNDEFHCKYLEYFRRLYADESEEYDSDDDDVTMASGYDNDDGVSAIRVRGRVEHHADDDDDDNGSPRSPTDGDDGDYEVHSKITFPIDQTTVRGGRSQVTVIKSVARIFGGRHTGDNEDDTWGSSPVRVRVFGRLSTDGSGVPREKPSLVADLTWPIDGDGGRWKDVDVTRLLRPRRRHSDGGGGDDNVTLELSLRYSAAGMIHFRDDGGRHPVLHSFFQGTRPDDGGTAERETVRCPGETKRIKRDSHGHRHGRGGKRRRPSKTGRVRRTDCKADAPLTGNNGTERGLSNKCCREQMRVVFAEIPGFDFIVEPKWFDAGLCRGRCPAKYNPATRHAYIQSLMWKQHYNNRVVLEAGNEDRNRGRRKVRHHGGTEATVTSQPPPKPCCAPSKLDQLEIIHVDEMNPNLLKVTTWKEMAVVECACS